MIVATLLLVYSLLMLMQAISTMDSEVKPLLASVQQTVGIVKETVKTAGNTVSTIGSTARLTTELALAPSVRSASAAIAALQMLGAFFGKSRSRVQERRRQQMKALLK